MNKEVEDEYKEGYLFKSYHGMIKAMTTFMPDFKRTENFFFEIALTSDTSKVSSCFPCSTFMYANNNLPTSTHLGRGDNWSIPDGAVYLKRPWEEKIIEWYENGRKIMGDKNQKSEGVKMWEEFMNQFSIDHQQIPDVFLESLTFERSFTERINNTLNG